MTSNFLQGEIMTIDAQRTSKFRVFQRRDIDALPRLAALPASERQMMKVVSAVLPFQVNNYVIDGENRFSRDSIGTRRGSTNFNQRLASPRFSSKRTWSE